MIIPWAARKPSDCSTIFKAQVNVESAQSKAVAEISTEALKEDIAGDLAAGYLTLQFIGKQFHLHNYCSCFHGEHCRLSRQLQISASMTVLD